MTHAGYFTLGSIEAIRPVFWIVMGVFLLLYAWRLAQCSGRWTSRLMVAGALLLACGYTLVLPMYEAGLLERYASERRNYQGSADIAFAWHVVRAVVMNLGWFAFGLGMAMHAGIIRLPARRTIAQFEAEPQSLQPTHDLAA